MENLAGGKLFCQLSVIGGAHTHRKYIRRIERRVRQLEQNGIFAPVVIRMNNYQGGGPGCGSWSLEWRQLGPVDAVEPG